MNVSYDPSEIPVPTEDMLLASSSVSGQLALVVCNGSETHVSFWSIYESLPRVGEKIWLQDRSVCEVADVMHCVTNSDALVVDCVVRILCKPVSSD